MSRQVLGPFNRVEGDHSFFPGCRIYCRSGDGFGFSGLVFEEHQTLAELIRLYSGNLGGD